MIWTTALILEAEKKPQETIATLSFSHKEENPDMENDIYRITYVLNMLPKWGNSKSLTPVPIKNTNAIIASASLFLKKNVHHPHYFLESPLVISDT